MPRLVHTPVQPGFAPGRDPEVGEGPDEDLFDGPHVGNDPLGVGQSNDRVSDQLAGTVVGDVSSPVDVEALGSDLDQSLGGDQQVGAVAVAPQRVDVGMFLQQQVVGGAPSSVPPLPEGPLQVPGLLVREASQPSRPQESVVGRHPEKPVGLPGRAVTVQVRCCSQSQFSRLSFIRRRNSTAVEPSKAR